MGTLIDALRIGGAVLLIVLALAAILDRHQALLSYLGRALDQLVRGLILALTFGRVRVPQMIRTSRRRQARRRRMRRLARTAPATPAGPAATWRVGRSPGDPEGWDGDEQPPGLG